MTVAPGTTVAEMVAAALPGLAESDRKNVRVTLGQARCPRGQLGARAAEARGDGYHPPGAHGRSFRAILRYRRNCRRGGAWTGVSCAVSLRVRWALRQDRSARVVTTSLVGAAAGAAAALAFNALVPLKLPGGAGGEQGSPTYSIQGFQNAANPNGTVPSVLGKHRFAPPYAVMPYTEVVDDEQYVVAAFNFGYGPVEIENIRLGDVAISTFLDAVYEVRQGLPDDEPLTLITEQVIEESVEVEGTNPDDADSLPGEETVRTTARNATDVSVDFTFPEGLAEYEDDGSTIPLEVQILIRQRLLGAEAFDEVTTLVICAGRAQRGARLASLDLACAGSVRDWRDAVDG